MSRDITLTALAWAILAAGAVGWGMTVHHAHDRSIAAAHARR